MIPSRGRSLKERFEDSSSVGEQSSRSKPLILYLYLHCTSDAPIYHPYEYRFLETLCKKYTVIVAYFTRNKKVKVPSGLVPRDALLLPLRDLPLPGFLPSKLRWFFDTYARIFRVFMTVRALRPDILDGNWITRQGGIYCVLSGFHPFVATAWGSDILIEAERSKPLRIIGKLTVRIADAVIVDSQIQRKAVLSLGCPPARIYEFPWGIDLDQFRPLRNNALRDELGWTQNKIVISTRNHSTVYGLEYLIRAIPTVLRRVKDARFLIAGDGPLLAYHTAIAEKLGVQEYVRFLGRVPNKLLPEILSSADLYVSTSFSDGTSASLLEAMATGLPAVVTEIAANKEWITEEVNGLFVPTGDSQALADRIIQLLENDKLRIAISQNNLQVARQRADWKTNSLVLESCFSDMLEK